MLLSRGKELLLILQSRRGDETTKRQNSRKWVWMNRDKQGARKGWEAAGICFELQECYWALFSWAKGPQICSELTADFPRHSIYHSIPYSFAIKVHHGVQLGVSHIAINRHASKQKMRLYYFSCSTTREAFTEQLCSEQKLSRESKHQFQVWLKSERPNGSYRRAFPSAWLCLLWHKHVKVPGAKQSLKLPNAF